MVQSLLQPNSVRTLFSVMKGKFDKNNIVEKLNNLGYQLKSYNSIDYYSIYEDYRLGGPDSPREILMAKGFLNRMMIEEREIIASPADGSFFSVLDVRSGKASSLEGSPPIPGLPKVWGCSGCIILNLSFALKCELGNLHNYDLPSVTGWRDRTAS
jgi:hypothetical protein